MSQELQPAGDNLGQKRWKLPEWVSQLIFPMIVLILGALLVTTFTPLGTSMRELLFHTRATVAGSVTVDGKPAVNVNLKLDGADWGNTDAGGRFLLTEVGKGQHRLHLELVGTKPRDEMFSVASGQTALQVGNLEMEPLVRLAYTPIVHMSSQQFDYDITLWIIGDPDVLSRIKSVSYTLPTPLSPHPVSGASANHEFCYRQTGSFSFQDPPLGGSGAVLALAIVDLGAGVQFQISAPASTIQPPDCPAQRAGAVPAASTTPAQSQQPSSPQGQQQPSSPGQFSSSPTSSTTPPTVPNVVGLSQASAQTSLQSAGFSVNVQTAAGPAGTIPGNVWQQNPMANKTAALGTTVTVLVQPQAPTSSPTSTPSHQSG
jgi:PASTA domain